MAMLNNQRVKSKILQEPTEVGKAVIFPRSFHQIWRSGSCVTTPKKNGGSIPLLYIYMGKL